MNVNLPVVASKSVVIIPFPPIITTAPTLCVMGQRLRLPQRRVEVQQPVQCVRLMTAVVFSSSTSLAHQKTAQQEQQKTCRLNLYELRHPLVDVLKFI